MLPTAYVSHELTGRVRIRIPERKGDEAYFARVGQTLSQAKGIISIQVNSLTGSLLIRHNTTAGDLLRFGEDRELFVLQSATDGRENVLNRAVEGVEKAEDLVYRITQGASSLNEVLFLSLLGLAGLQVLRGHALGPATALLSYAADLLALHRHRGAR